MAGLQTIFDPVTAPAAAPAPAAPAAPPAAVEALPAPVEAEAAAPAVGAGELTPRELLRKGIIPTEVSPRTAWTMAGLFVAGITLLPLAQAAWELRRGEMPQALKVLSPVKNAMSDAASGQPRKALGTLKYALTREHLHTWERQLEEASVARRLVKPRLQHAMLRTLGFAHTDVVVPLAGGRPTGWLFYEVNNEYLSGPPFLDEGVLARRRRKMAEEDERAEPDPRPAILRFHRDCAAAGAHLVFIPVPVKPMLQPGELSPRLRVTGRTPVMNNPSYARFVAELRAAGVDVFDPTPPFLTPDDAPRYLRQDTHWTPDWMEEVAAALARHVRERGVDLGAAPSGFSAKVVEESVQNWGDILTTMALPQGQTVLEPQPVTIRKVVDARTGKVVPWDPSSSILVLGDSFSNIFSDARKGWGEGAGFPYQLVRLLGRPIDALVRDGAAATELREELAGREEPLRGKRLVIWQVAMHELSVGDWRIVDLGGADGDGTRVANHPGGRPGSGGASIRTDTATAGR